MSKVLVTGGAGFIGSHLVDRLIKLGYKVIVIDNEKTGFRENVHPKADYVKGDVRNINFLKKIFEKNKIEIVFHLAAQVSNIKSFDNPEEDLSINVGGSLNVLKLALKYKVPRLLYASSMATYGQPEKMPVSEGTPCKPLSFYGTSKYAAERYFLIADSRKDLDFEFNVTAFRMFNVYGERQSLLNPYQGVISVFIANLLNNEPITLYGTGKHSRDFIHVDDVVSAWTKAINDKKTFGEAINLGTGKEITINQLINYVLKAFGKNRRNYQIIKKTTLPGDQAHIRANILKAKKILNWVPKIDFYTGIERTIKWAREQEKKNGQK